MLGAPFALPPQRCRESSKNEDDGDEHTQRRKQPIWRHFPRGFTDVRAIENNFALAWKWRSRPDVPHTIHTLRDAGTRHAENWDAIFRRAQRRDAGVQLVLMLPPIRHVHRGHDEHLRALADEFIGDARVAQVVTDTDADLAPRRVPDFLFRRGQAVLEELDGHALDLFENNFAIRADDEGGVVIVGIAERLLATDDEELLVRATPILERVRWLAVQGVFGQDNEVYVRRIIQPKGSLLFRNMDNAIKCAHSFMTVWKFQLTSSQNETGPRTASPAACGWN